MKIRAIYKNNVLKPLEKLDLKEGEEVNLIWSQVLFIGGKSINMTRDYIH